MTRKRSLAATAVLAALVAVTWNGPIAAQEPLQTIRAQRATVERERVLDGVIEAVDHSTVSAQVSARVTAVNFDVDDFVEEGKVIVELDDTEYRAQLAQAEAALAGAAARLAEARAQFSRIESLYERRTASQADFDRARRDLESARAEHDAAEAAVIRGRQQLDYTSVRAPYSGVVTERHIELGEVAAPGTPLMSGVSMSKLRATVDVPQQMIGQVRQFLVARVLRPGDGQAIEAASLTIFPYAPGGGGTVPVRVRLPDDTAGLFPGMLVKVAFVIGERSSLVVPADSLVYRGEVVGVYVVGEDDRVSLRYVRAGAPAPDNMIEILSGLDEGERIAAYPALATGRARGQAAQ
ncbi:MAG: efflux RND transporter periplasmic adaptor subunit [Gammaproteobacteria bacterium]|nr:efflux RND transporter periplasmic adaptor subunit [Gammaproteobacteria bacterium]